MTLVSLAVTGLLASFTPQIRSDNSRESFLRRNDPARVDYDDYRAQFGQDDLVVIAVTPPEVFDLVFLERLREFHRTIERDVPYVDEVTSLLNARNTRGDGDRLIVEDLLETWPSSQADLLALRARVLETPLYENTLVNRGATLTTITIKPFAYSTVGPEQDLVVGFEERPEAAAAPFLSDAETSAMVGELEEIIRRFEAPDFELYLTGGIVANRHSTRMMMNDVQIFLSGSIGVNALILYALFGRVGAVVLSLATVLASLLSTFGVMAILDIPASISGQIVPPLLLTVGICGAIHLLVLVYRQLGAGESREDAIAFALGHSGLPIMMASLTTAAGLLSFSTAELAQVANLGTVAPIGVMMSFLYVVSLLPALLAILPISRRTSSRSEAVQLWFGRSLARVGVAATRNAWKIVAATVAITLIGAIGISRLRFSQFPMEWLPEHDPLRRASELIDREFRGINNLELVLDTGRENGLYDPAVLNRIESAMAFAESYDDGQIYVGKVVSIVDVLKEIHKALNENQQPFYAIPQDRELVAQELLLFENSGSDDLEELTDSQFRLARVSLRVPMVDDMHFPAFAEAIERGFAERLGDGIRVHATGLGILFARSFSLINVTLARSYLLALAIITPLMVLLIGNLKRGLMAMIPNLLPIFMTLGLMGALGIELDNSTLLVGCIIIGLAVDDTIHFMHKFQRYYAQTPDASEAVARTLETAGSALLFTSLVLASGFLVMTLAYMKNIGDFGMLASFAIGVAFLADIVLAPALMSLSVPPRRV